MLSQNVIVSEEVLTGLKKGQPIVALESSMLVHNPDVAHEILNRIRLEGVIPAVVAVIAGQLKVGLDDSSFYQYINSKPKKHLAKKDLPFALAMGLTASTNINLALFVTAQLGIKVLVTGAIGGVTRSQPFDVSSDLDELGQTPSIVVCSGIKAFLDIEASREYLETKNVPILGYGTTDLPALYFLKNGLSVDFQVDSPNQVALISKKRDQLGLRSSILLAVPPPDEDLMDESEFEAALTLAVNQVRELNIQGSAVTPNLMAFINKFTNGKASKVALSALFRNAQVASLVAKSLCSVVSV